MRYLPAPFTMEEAREVFMSRFTIEPGGCWIWTGCKAGNGYGAIKINQKQYGAHQMAYLFFRGPLPKGLMVCHHCDNPLCVNPKHLFLGTALDNVRDMYSKGRQNPPRGSAGSAILTEEQVLEIRKLASESGISRSNLAKSFGVKTATIGAVVRRTNWRHI
jgi:hypothetical protein